MSGVHVVTSGPLTNSKPALQEYVALSPMETPVKVTTPLLGLVGIEQRATTVHNVIYTTIQKGE